MPRAPTRSRSRRPRHVYTESRDKFATNPRAVVHDAIPIGDDRHQGPVSFSMGSSDEVIVLRSGRCSVRCRSSIRQGAPPDPVGSPARTRAACPTIVRTNGVEPGVPGAPPWVRRPGGRQDAGIFRPDHHVHPARAMILARGFVFHDPRRKDLYQWARSRPGRATPARGHGRFTRSG